MNVPIDSDWSKAGALAGYIRLRENVTYEDAVTAIAQALASERERARAPFLAYADKCAAIGDDSKAGFLKRAVNRSVAQAFHRAAEETDQ